MANISMSAITTSIYEVICAIMICSFTTVHVPIQALNQVHSPRVYTSQGVPISVVGTAQVRTNTLAFLN